MFAKMLCFWIAACLCVCLVQGHQVSVTVYYESLCPDSRKFFSAQLYPTLQEPSLVNRINLTLVPYGLSTTDRTEGIQFKCHHGPFECRGNQIHACALREIEQVSPKPADAGFNNISVAFINCIMDRVENKTTPSAPAFDFHMEECAANMTTVRNVQDIQNCSQQEEGAELLAKMGELTAMLEPKLKSVPTIVFDHKFSMEDNKLSQTNFLKALCQHITQDVPAKCKSSSSGLTLSALALAFVLIKQLF